MTDHYSSFSTARAVAIYQYNLDYIERIENNEVSCFFERFNLNSLLILIETKIIDEHYFYRNKSQISAEQAIELSRKADDVSGYIARHNPPNRCKRLFLDPSESEKKLSKIREDMYYHYIHLTTGEAPPERGMIEQVSLF